MRKDPLITGHYYHIYNRGVDKRDIVLDQKDSERFLLSMKLFSMKEPIGSIRDFLESGQSPDVGRLGKEKLVSIAGYCLNPNHFHFLLKQEVDGGISEFMKRFQGGYTRYFNDKNDRSGSLLQGKFKSVYAEKEGYFQILCAYVPWNYRMHDIPPNKRSLTRSSVNEYRSGKFSITSKKSTKFVLEMFGGYKGLEEHAKEMISILRVGRGKTELEDEFSPDSLKSTISQTSDVWGVR